MKNKIIKLCKIIISILFIVLILLLVIFIVHRILLNKEYNELKENGYINKYSVGDYDLNLYRIGNKHSEYKIIGLSGLGVNNFSIEMSKVNESLKDDYEIIYIDRAGYGYSDDTNKKQTVEQIVSDYRTVLKNAGINGKIILMPHSLGGLYATYWESNYPEEIEAIIFIDTSELGLDIWDEDMNVGIKDYIGSAITKIGLQRFVLHKYYYEMPNTYTDKEKKYSDYLNIVSFENKAKISELKEINNNTNKTFNNIKSNDIPKIYIESSNGNRTIEEYKETLKWISKRTKEIGLNTITKMPSDETIMEMIDEAIKWEDEHLMPYINKLGNTEVVLLPGDHYIFEQKPEELSRIIKEFITTIK